MKKIITIAFLACIVSCGDHDKATTTGNSDQTILDSTAPADSMNSTGTGTPGSGTGHAATGTTGTGTVSDSGNAANPGSDTSYHKSK